MTGEWRELHNEELNDLQSSLNFVRVTQSKIMGCVGHRARLVEG